MRARSRKAAGTELASEVCVCVHARVHWEGLGDPPLPLPWTILSKAFVIALVKPEKSHVGF